MEALAKEEYERAQTSELKNDERKRKRKRL
jgi:hypothetical protein